MSRSRSTSSATAYEVRLSRQVEDYLDDLKSESLKQWEACWRLLKEIGEDPFHPRPGADIRRWRGPQFDWEVRKGRHRFGYRVHKRERVVYVDAAWFK